jgi:MFS family permease
VKSVQSYIDEVPEWPDGTGAPDAPVTPMQWRIFGLACAGKFFEGMVVFMTGVALPLVTVEFSLGPADAGMVTAASLAGILVGATALGGLADAVGRKAMFISEMGLFVAFLAALVFCPNFPALVFCLFGAGVALGCDYPTAHLVISESIPSKARGRLVLAAFAFQSVGALFGSMAGFAILHQNPDVGAWRWMYGVAVLPAVLVFAARFTVVESPQWLAAGGRLREAEAALLRLLRRVPSYPTKVELSAPPAPAKEGGGSFAGLWRGKNLRATVLASVPWFLQDLGTYGIGIFTPTILATVLGHPGAGHGLSAIVHNDMLAAKGSAFMDVFFFAGIIAAILLVDRFGRINLQVAGFIGCATGLAMAALSVRADGSHNMPLLFAGFTIFYFMTNLGPNSMTYLLAGEVFPTRLRGKGAGFAASAGKVGAVLTAFLFPVLLQTMGTVPLLASLAAASVLGAAVTKMFAIDTNGKNLEAVGGD